MYGRSGESERLIARAIGRRRDEMVIATKCGLHTGPESHNAHDARPATLRRECEESLRRLETDHVELLYLHAPDKNVPVGDSAGELKRLLDEGKTRAVGASNLSVAQLEEFSAECPLAAFQPPYNMLMRHIEADTLPWCRRRGVAVLGLLAADEGTAGRKIGPRPGVRVPTTAGTSILCSRARSGRRTTTWSIGCKRLPRRRAIACRTRDQLDDSAAGHHCRTVRRQAARSDPRLRRWKRLATHGRTTRTNRSSVGRTRTGGCATPV